MTPPFFARSAARLASATAFAMWGQRLPIVIFHRVHARPDPLFPDEMDAARFDRLMAWVAGSFRVRTLRESVEHQRQGRLPPRSLVITFDDGYADNAEVALPILRRHGLAADFFISTGFLDGGRMWNDTVIESLRRSTCKFIDLDEFGLGRMPLSSHAERRQAIDRILPRLKYLALQERDAAVVRVQRLAGDPALPNDLMMRTEHVRELHKAGMEIGGHTVRHPILCALPDGEAEAEIAAGKAQLESVIDTSVDVMAYPNGEPGRDYDGRHVAMVRRLGFKCAVTTASGAADAASDPFQLPRFTPWDRLPIKWTARLLWNLRRNHFATVAVHAEV